MNPPKHPPVPKPSAEVVVRFQGSDFVEVVQAAARSRLTLGAFIREAAIEEAARGGPGVTTTNAATFRVTA